MGSVPLAEMIISTRPAGAVMQAEVLRGTQRLTLSIPVSEQKNDVDQLGDLVDPEKDLIAKLGIYGVEIDEQLAKQLEDLREPTGVIVAALAADSLGVEADLQPGDVIHALNGKTQTTLEDLRADAEGLCHRRPRRVASGARRKISVRHVRDGLNFRRPAMF